jgi:hypothetical protein
MSLWSEYENGTEMSIFKWDHYLPVYEKFLSEYRNRSVLLFEIGVMGGGSLELWRKYLGPGAMIVGLDIDPACQKYASQGISVEIGNQSDRHFLATVVAKYGAPDIVIDDGSHLNVDTLASFGYFKSVMQKNGKYIIEDLHTAYMASFAGNGTGSGSIYDLMRSEVDLMHSKYVSKALPTVDQRPIGNHLKVGISGMHIYDSVLVFEFDYLFEPHATQSHLTSKKTVTHEAFARDLSWTSIDKND